MSVVLSVGYLDEMRRLDQEGFEHWRQRFKGIKEMLKKKHLPVYDEPKDLEGKGWWAQVLPGNGIAYLQRLAVSLWQKETLPTPGTGEMNNPLKDPDIEIVYEDCYFNRDDSNSKGQNFQHLVCHSCVDGYWLPVELPNVLVARNVEYGSSVRLKDELEEIAEELKLPLGLDVNDKDVRQALDNPGKGRTRWKKYGIESFNCLLLHKAACKSVELGAAIVFH